MKFQVHKAHQVFTHTAELRINQKEKYLFCLNLISGPQGPPGPAPKVDKNIYDQIMTQLKSYKEEMHNIYEKNIKYDTEVAKKIDSYASGSYPTAGRRAYQSY